MIGKQKKGLEMTTTINKEQKNPNVPNLRFPEFSGEWMYSTIGSEFDLYSGNTPSRLNKEQFKGDVNWISSGELKEHYISETKEKITQEAAKNNNLKLLPIGTFVIAIYGLEAEGIRGTCSITRGLSTISQACMAFTPIGSITNEFLYSWYKKHGNLIGIKYAQGTKQQNLSYDIISQFQIDYPQREEQVKLEQFISLLDERIATQNKIIEDLKKLKCAIIETVYNGKGHEYRIGDIIDQVSQRNKRCLVNTVLSVNNKLGFINQDEQFEDRTVASEDTSNYKVVFKDDFAYNPTRINVGSIARLKSFDKGIVSPMYICFKVTDGIVPEYLESYFATNHFSKEMQKRLEGSVRLCLSFEGLCNIPIFVPCIDEQTEIGKRIYQLENKIETECNILSLYEKQKQYLLRQMFI